MAQLTVDLIAPRKQTGAPALKFVNGNEQIRFDSAAEENVILKTQAMDDFASGLHVKGVISMTGANTGTKGVVLGCRVQAVSPDAAETFDNASGWATQVKQRVVINNTADNFVAFDIDMSSNDDGLAAGDVLYIEFGRVGDDTTTGGTGDDAAGDMSLETLTITYTAS